MQTAQLSDRGVGGGVVDALQTEGLGGPDIVLNIINEHAFRGCQAKEIEGVPEDLLVGLTQTDLTGDDDRVEQASEQLTRVVVTPGVGQQGGAATGGTNRTERRVHRLDG